MKQRLALLIFAFAAFLAPLNAEVPASAAPAEEISAEKSLPEKVVAWYAENLNYGTVALLMTVESSFIPFPSEVVVPPAAYAACNPESSLYVTENRWVNIGLVIAV